MSDSSHKYLMADDKQPENLSDDEDSGYKVSKKVAINELMEKDQDDEALQRYKQALLGDVAETTPFPDNPAQVILESASLMFADHEPIVIDPTKTDIHFTVKEGEEHSILLKFYVQREIVSGLRFLNQIYKHKIRVEKIKEMLGSFGPKRELYEFTVRDQVIPSGMMARGKYSAKITLTDDEKTNHMEVAYTFDIKKDW